MRNPYITQPLNYVLNNKPSKDSYSTWTENSGHEGMCTMWPLKVIDMFPVYMNNMGKNRKLDITWDVNKTLKYTCLVSKCSGRYRQEDYQGSEVQRQPGNIARFSLKRASWRKTVYCEKYIDIIDVKHLWAKAELHGCGKTFKIKHLIKNI